MLGSQLKVELNNGGNVEYVAVKFGRRGSRFHFADIRSALAD